MLGSHRLPIPWAQRDWSFRRGAGSVLAHVHVCIVCARLCVCVHVCVTQVKLPHGCPHGYLSSRMAWCPSSWGPCSLWTGKKCKLASPCLESLSYTTSNTRGNNRPLSGSLSKGGPFRGAPGWTLSWVRGPRPGLPLATLPLILPETSRFRQKPPPQTCSWTEGSWSTPVPLSGGFLSLDLLLPLRGDGLSPPANGDISPTSTHAHGSLGSAPSGVGLGSCISDKFPGDSMALPTWGPWEDCSPETASWLPHFLDCSLLIGLRRCDRRESL